jgi:hypothetical protein
VGWVVAFRALKFATLLKFIFPQAVEKDDVGASVFCLGFRYRVSAIGN